MSPPPPVPPAPARQKSRALFADCLRRIPGGVNSPVRAFNGVGGEPVFIRRADGAILTDVDGNDYTDYVCSFGAVIVGHAHPAVVQALSEAAQDGLGYGAPTATEEKFSAALCAIFPALEMVRAVNSGTEAVMSAIRVARGYTGRARIVKFAGCYHGHADALLVAAGSGAQTLGVPSSAGVPDNAVKDTTVLAYNDTAAVAAYFQRHGDETAAVLVEPVAGNMNLVRPAAGFLDELRAQCDRHGALLIADEVMSGCRVAHGGACQRFNLRPDLLCLGKVIGGGLNVAAFGGRKDIMQHLAPLGGVYQAGTLSGNPVALAAGLATLSLIAADGFYDGLEKTGARLCEGLQAAAAAAGVAFSAQSVGGMFGFYFCETPPTCLADMEQCDSAKFRAFFHAMLTQGIYFAPSQYEAGFFGCAHDDAVIDDTIEKAKRAFAAVKNI